MKNPFNLEIEIYHPKEPTKEVENQASLIGLNMFNLLQTFEHIKKELTLESAKKPHIMWQLINGLISVVSTDDFNQIHIEIVKAALNSLENNPLENKSIDTKSIIYILARKLNEYCTKLKIYLCKPKNFLDTYNNIKKIGDKSDQENSSLVIIDFSELYSDDLESLFEKNNMFIWDNEFIGFIKSFGKTGKELSKKLEKTLKNNFKSFKDKKTNPLDFWFNLNPTVEKPFYLSPALQLLSQIIWCDETSHNERLITKGVPAITNIVQPKITKTFAPGIEIKDINNKEIGLFENKTMLGRVIIPVTSPKIIGYIRNGLSEFDSVVAQRYLRHLIKWPFAQRISGIEDYRVLRFDGAFSQIAEKMQLKGKKAITQIKHLSYAMDHFKFTGPEITSSLISLAMYKSPITQRHDACEITVLSPLIPYRTFEDGGLLIPLLNDPPVVGHTFYHARQFNLQWYIIAEFSTQSISLARDEAIQVTENRWKELLEVCKIPQNYLSKIQEAWTSEEGFLEKIDKDFYTLRKENNKQLEFLKQQGLLRKNRREKALIAIEKRNKKL